MFFAKMSTLQLSQVWPSSVSMQANLDNWINNWFSDGSVKKMVGVSSILRILDRNE